MFLNYLCFKLQPMLIYKNSLPLSEECYNNLKDYENLSLEDFKKYVKCILITHKSEFGLNKTYTDYLIEFSGKEEHFKEEIVLKMAEFINLLHKKDLV